MWSHLAILPGCLAQVEPLLERWQAEQERSCRAKNQMADWKLWRGRPSKCWQPARKLVWKPEQPEWLELWMGPPPEVLPGLWQEPRARIEVWLAV